VKIGDLVKYSDTFVKGYGSKVESLIGIISYFDEDDDPVVLWFRDNTKEPNFRSHIKVISVC
jgi:hypothetical protein